MVREVLYRPFRAAHSYYPPGATTYRLKTHGMVIFLDTWLDRPSVLQQFLDPSEVKEADYVFISHAHFDHLPGADIIAKKTGAIVIGNGEAIQVMRQSGVPETQLMAVAGGERIPLFTKAQRSEAIELAGKGVPLYPRPGPPTPHPSAAPVTVHAWPSLHCLLPPGDLNSMPEICDTSEVYIGSESHAGTLDITRKMTYGLGGMLNAPPGTFANNRGLASFVDYMKDTASHKYSYFDGGQMCYNFLLGSGKTLFWSAHLGGYAGILRDMQPKPDIAVLGIAGRANLNGRPYDGSAAQFAVEQLKWIGGPSKVIWCLHDESCLKPFSTDTSGATKLVESATKSRVWDLEYTVVYDLFKDQTSG